MQAGGYADVCLQPNVLIHSEIGKASFLVAESISNVSEISGEFGLRSLAKKKHCKSSAESPQQVVGTTWISHERALRQVVVDDASPKNN
jgi:hypothetical protein